MLVFSQLIHHIASQSLKKKILKPRNEEDDERDEMDLMAEWYDYCDSDMDESEFGSY